MRPFCEFTVNSMSGTHAAHVSPSPDPTVGLGTLNGGPKGHSYADKMKAAGKPELPMLEPKSGVEAPDITTVHAFIREERDSKALMLVEEFLKQVRGTNSALKVKDCVPVSTVRGWKVVHFRGTGSLEQSRAIANEFNTFIGKKREVGLASTNESVDRAAPWATTFLRIRPIRDRMKDKMKTAPANKMWEGAWPVTLRQRVCEITQADPEACRLEASGGRISLRVGIAPSAASQLEAWLQAHDCAFEQVSTLSSQPEGTTPLVRREMMMKDLDIADLDRFSDVGNDILRAIVGNEITAELRGDPRRICEGLHWAIVWQVWLPEGTIPSGGKAKISARGHVVSLLPEKRAYTPPSIGFAAEKRTKAPMANAADRPPPQNGNASQERDRRRASVPDARPAAQTQAVPRPVGKGATVNNHTAPMPPARTGGNAQAAISAVEAARVASEANRKIAEGAQANRRNSVHDAGAAAAVTAILQQPTENAPTTPAASSAVEAIEQSPNPASTAAGEIDEFTTPPRTATSQSACRMIEAALGWNAEQLRDRFMGRTMPVFILRNLAEWARCAVVIHRNAGKFMFTPLKFDQQDEQALEQGKYDRVFTLKVSNTGKTLMSVVSGGAYSGAFSRCNDSTVLPDWISGMQIQA